MSHQVASSQGKIKVGIVGGTGYTGVELLRILAAHPFAEVVSITSRSEAGQRVDDFFPNLRGFCDLEFVAPDSADLVACELVFYATPHGVAMRQAPELLEKGVRVVDLGADFRIKNIPVWEHWYGETHVSPEWVERAAYGLTEIHRDSIRKAQLVANPGCYPTVIQLGFLPLLEQGLVDISRLIADAKSGVSGAGRQAKLGSLMGEVGESFKAYGASGHRHGPEIREWLQHVTKAPVGLTFVPHLVPMIRGMEATLYAELKSDHVDLQALYEERYAQEPFVDVMPFGSHPETRTVRGANHCRLALHRQENSRTLIVSGVIDNLVKGASGQAVQNMNVMFGLPETAGFAQPALLP